MRVFFDHGAGPTALIILACSQAIAVNGAAAEPLALPEAQELAVQRDAGLLAIESESGALRELAVAAGQLPDPEARVGAVNVPTDTFALDAEDMTMLEVGVMQRFPAGRSRALAQSGLERQADAAEATAADRGRMVRLEVERAWREIDYLERSLDLLDEQLRWSQALVTSVAAAYAAGQGTQAGLLDARLMLLEVEERRIEKGRDLDVARAGLERWTGPGVSADRIPALPPTGELVAVETLVERLDAHPRLASREQGRLAALAAADLAVERYKPAFGVDLAYGFRQGGSMGGGARPDMLTAMLTFDVPLFTRDRQDRDAAAARARARAADAEREDEWRDLESRLRAGHASAVRLSEIIGLYERQTGRLADVSFDSALSAYEANDGSLREVIDSQQRVLAVRDRQLRLRTDYALVRAELDYLAGVTP